MRWITQDRILDPVIVALEDENERLRAENIYLRKQMGDPALSGIVTCNDDVEAMPELKDYMTLRLAAKSALQLEGLGVRVNARAYTPDGGKMEWGILVNREHLAGNDDSHRMRYLGDVAVQAIKSIGGFYDLNVKNDRKARAELLEE